MTATTHDNSFRDDENVLKLTLQNIFKTLDFTL